MRTDPRAAARRRDVNLHRVRRLTIGAAAGAAAMTLAGAGLAAASIPGRSAAAAPEQTPQDGQQQDGQFQDGGGFGDQGGLQAPDQGPGSFSGRGGMAISGGS